MTPAILFELHHLGDAVLSLPFVRAAAQVYDLHIVCREHSRAVFAKILPPERIHCWEPWWELARSEKAGSLAVLPELLRQLKALRPGMSCAVWADSRVHALMWLTGAPIRIGFPVNPRNFYAHELPWRHRRMRLGQLMQFFVPLTRSLQRSDYQQAHLEDWRQLTLAAGCFWKVGTPWLETTPNPNLESLRRPGQPLWVLHPGGRLPTKRWPIDRFESLLRDHLAEIPVAIIRPPDSPAPRLVSPLHHLVETPDFNSLASTLAAADAVLCNDSLVSHLAAALGKKVCTIFGSGNPNWFAPFANERRVIASDVCPYRPCIDRCVQPSPICLEGVQVEQVAARMRAVINE